MNETLIDIGLWVAYILIVAGLLIAIITSVIHMSNNPRRAKNTIIGIVALLLVIGISYLFSSDAVYPAYERFGIGTAGSKWIGAGIISMYIMLGIAIIGLIASEVASMFK